MHDHATHTHHKQSASFLPSKDACAFRLVVCAGRFAGSDGAGLADVADCGASLLLLPDVPTSTLSVTAVILQ